MGTRADFYVGSGQDAEWLGSVAWDGYEWDEEKDSLIASATTESGFRVAVNNMLAQRRDGTTPDMGWPWPWETSATTDYVYWFENGSVKNSQFGEEIDWPNMKDRQNVTFGDRSGVIVVST